jgi:hypothetical protein
MLKTNNIYVHGQLLYKTGDPPDKKNQRSAANDEPGLSIDVIWR